MTRSLSHRGPDDEGYSFMGPAALGHRRLSVIDIAGGSQPMRSADGALAVAHNGEIYNFQDLRDDLQKTGLQFSTQSDTEVVLQSYAQHGVDCLEQFNGMFAFAIWDASRRRLFCARDRMGQKPLYYTVIDGEFAVASELKALMRHPRLRRQIDYRALSAYLALESVPAPMSILRGVAKLQPGHYFCVDLDNPPDSTESIEQVRYWDIPFAPRERPDSEIARELTESLGRAVERRLISDVPLGVFLSGGIDSSAVVAMMAELREGKDIKTFNIAFEEASFDESSYAQQVARHFGTDHYEERMSARRLLDIMPRVADTLCEPFADPSIMPMYLLCEFTRKHVTVALGGDGNDELFAGYDPFQAHPVGRWVGRLPRAALRALARAAHWLPTSRRNISLDFMIKRFLEGVVQAPSRRHCAWLGSFPPDWQRELLAPDVLAEIDPDVAYAMPDVHWGAAQNADDLHRVIYQYCKMYLQDDILVKTDRASMAHGLEARAPMLDHEFVEWAGTVPSNRKLRRLTKKYIFKKAMKGFLPGDTIERRKKGFGIPIAEWFRGPLRSHIEARLGEKSIAEMGLFRPEAVRKTIDDHLSGKRDNRKEIWTLLSFVEWHRRYMS